MIENAKKILFEAKIKITKLIFMYNIYFDFSNCEFWTIKVALLQLEPVVLVIATTAKDSRTKINLEIRFTQ